MYIVTVGDVFKKAPMTQLLQPWCSLFCFFGANFKISNNTKNDSEVNKGWSLEDKKKALEDEITCRRHRDHRI